MIGQATTVVGATDLSRAAIVRASATTAPT